MIITDEMVEKAEAAASDLWTYAKEAPSGTDAMRAALEAVAPMLQKALTDADICRAKAQGMLDAAKVMHDTPLVDEYNDDGSMSPNWRERWNNAGDAILERAQELAQQ